MYLHGSKWSMNRRQKRSNPLRIIILLALVGAALYVNQVVVPTTPPLFLPTPTATRSPESYIIEGDALIKEGKIAQAIASYEQAVQSNPKNPTVFLTLARLQILSGNYKEGLTNTENALLLNQNNSMAHALQGWALSLQEEYLPAEAAFQKAIELDANNAVAYAYHAEMLVQQVANNKGDLGTLDKAKSESRMAQQINPDLMETHRARGNVLEVTSNYADAAKEFEAAIAIEPNMGDLHLALGRNYRALEDYPKAIEEFNKANALNPSDPLPDTYIARTYATVGEYAKAIQYAEQAVKEAPIDPYMWGNLGSMYYRNHQYSDAVKPLTLAVRGGKTDDGQDVQGLPLDYGRIAEYYYFYGLTLAKKGLCTDALPISQALLEGVKDDQVSVDNAAEIVTICEDVASGKLQPDGSTTPEAGADGGTAQPEQPASTEKAPAPEGTTTP